jgi:tetratricopeptide (TPR) repeat protein
VSFFEQGSRTDLANQVISENVEAITDDAQRGALMQKLAELREADAQPLAAGRGVFGGRPLAQGQRAVGAAERCFAAAEAWDRAAVVANERAQVAEAGVEKAALLATEAEYLSRAGDDASSVLRLEQATELDPSSDRYAAELEARYLAAERSEDLVSFLLRRADKLTERGQRAALRKQAAQLQRDTLGKPDAARLTLQELLQDGDDLEALNILADDAEQRSEFAEAVHCSIAWRRPRKGPSSRSRCCCDARKSSRDGLSDPKAAIEIYERLLNDFDASNDGALSKSPSYISASSSRRASPRPWNVASRCWKIPRKSSK